jgi:hypothetical protein
MDQNKEAQCGIKGDVEEHEHQRRCLSKNHFFSSKVPFSLGKIMINHMGTSGTFNLI